MAESERDPPPGAPVLRRSLGLGLAVLYGLGVTIGAGIYVLVGATAGIAGMQAPLAFVLAALVMAPSALSFGELASRFPVSAGEAAYVEAGFGSKGFAFATGIAVIVIGLITAAAITRGSAGYIRVFVDWPVVAVVAAVVLSMGAIAAWGIVESVVVAGVMTLIEIGGLLAIVAAGVVANPDLLSRLPEAWPSGTGPSAWAGVLSASLLAFFAFTGFEGLANIAEEVRQPQRTLPRAMVLTLGLATLLYVAVVWVALVAVPRSELASAQAPLSLVFERLTGRSPWGFSIIAIVATVNGIIVHMVMASRVIYGLARKAMLPAALARVNPVTRTPLVATIVVCAIIFALAAVFPLERLAEATSRLTLAVFALVNASLLALKLRKEPAPAGSFHVPIVVPAAGLFGSAGLLFAGLMF